MPVLAFVLVPSLVLVLSLVLVPVLVPALVLVPSLVLVPALVLVLVPSLVLVPALVLVLSLVPVREPRESTAFPAWRAPMSRGIRDPVDRSVLLWLNGLRSPSIDPVLGFLSEWGYFAFPIAMLFAMAGGREQARSIRDGWLTWFFAPFVSETILKPLIARPRPTADEGLRALLHVLGRVPPATSFAFPSGTAVACFAAAVFIQLRWGARYGVPALVLATLVSIARVAVGVHWPSDILAGAVLGAAFAIALSRLGRWIDR